jgi:speckle-type POZ protein
MAGHCTISVAAVSEKRSHVVKIHGCSVLPEKGACAKSAPFSVGGLSWAIKYYPLGNFMPGCVSIYLVLDSSHVKELSVKIRFSLLDRDGKPVPSHSHTSTADIIFAAKGSSQEIYLKSISHEDLEGSVHPRDDCFSIKCDIAVLKDANEGNKFVMVPPSDLHQQLGNLLKSMDGADVTFIVGGERFSAHRSVLAARSSVFKAELFGDMKENSCDPIEISDMEADVFKSLLHFVYTDSLPELTHEGTHDGGATRGDVVTASHLLVAADLYNIERLKLICEEKLCNHIDSNMVATTLALAEQHSCNGLKEACFEFLALPSNLEAMVASDGFEHLKSSCPTVLKELIARILPPEQKAAKDLVMAI